MTMNPKHLSNDELCELLVDGADGTQPLHLRECAHCRQELATLQEVLGNFREATTGLAAAKAPAELTQRVLVPASGGRLRGIAWAGSFATVAAAIALSISMLHAGHTAPSAANSNIQVAADSGQTSAVSDEALLDGIDQDLATSIPPSLAPLDVPAGRAKGSTHN